jgi:hypothetical protein
MKQNNVTPGQAVNQLFKWHMELAGPNKVQAFKQLAQSFGIDPSTLVASQSPDTQNNTNQTIPDNLKPIIEGLESRLKGYETNVAAQNQAAAQQTWSNWAKDKPHAEAVRMLMANLINSDLALMQSGQPQVSNTVKNGSIDMDTAYQAATYAHPEVRQLVLQEEQKKRDTAARDAAEKARKAGGSLRTGAPGGKVNSPNGNDALKVESPRESIQRALAEIKQR